MTKFITKLASTLVAASVVLIPATPAMARNHYNDRQYGYDDGRYYNNGANYENRRYNNRGYDNGGYYNQSNRYYSDNRCKNSGTGGTIIGAIAGGLLGREVIGRRGDKTVGTIVGAGVGALAGRAIDKSSGRRC